MNQYFIYLKKEIIFLSITFIIMAFGLYLYGTLNINTQNLKDEVSNLKNQLQTTQYQLNTMKKDYNKEIEFERETSNKQLIQPYNKTLDIYFVFKDLQSKIRLLFNNGKIQSNFKPLKGKYGLSVYKVTLYLPYENNYFYKRFFDYLNSKYYYYYDKVNYSSKSKTLMVEIYLIGKKEKRTHLRRRR